LKLVHGEEEVGETEEDRLAKEDAEEARRAFEGIDGERVRRITAETLTMTEDKISPVSLLQTSIKPHVFNKPAPRKRKEAGMNALGIVKKKTKLI
jgi:hypothetical protein